MRSALDDMHGDLVPQDLGEDKQVLVQQVKQLRRKLDTSGTAATDNKRQQTLAVLVTGGRQTGHLDIFQDLVLDSPGIVDCFQMVTVLEALDTMRVRHAT